MTEQSKYAAYEAGKAARATGKPVSAFRVTGWGYPKGQYVAWFNMGFYGDMFVSDPAAEPMPYAELKARKLIADQYRAIGQHSKAEAMLKPGYKSLTLKAFAAYIERTE